ncbi:GTP 3',8-cyclase MoaA [Alkalibacillus aidingensis]|uniref:GTP 3',8-cyclase MoaA n=1 Tax=Alkalibacillus aidingensis TaxID=2747607 RepID=UPI001660DA9A|nr:GTP 3',8-cyclase MoaA [Alkalibacillus aidingensis]
MATLKDRFGRPLQDLRISVIDRCNFRCTYCMPREVFGKDHVFMPKDELLSFEEIERLATIFSELGVKKIRLTGGEPLLRRDLPILINKLSRISGIEDLALTTNASLLTKMADDLKEAGLNRVNVSLDALDPALFQSITDSSATSRQILNGIDEAKKVGLGIKVNMVLKKGMNEEEIIPMAKYFKDKGITLRFIEFMDVGKSNGWDYSQVISKHEILEMLGNHFKLEAVEPEYIGEVAKKYRYVGTNTKIGIISSVSEPFCSSCTRARIAADGMMYNCLFAEKGIDFKAKLRSGQTKAEIKSAITNIWQQRNDRYSTERTQQTAKQKNKIEMSYIGG